jgi:hypothetical protein
MDSLCFANRAGALAVALCVVLVSGCAPEQEQPEYRLILGVADLMTQVLDPAADGIWESAGFIISEAGEENLAPTTQEGWDHAANSAAVVMETANLLMLPGRAQPGDWNEIAAGLADAGLAAKIAAENQDEEALFEAGATVYRVCLSCHQLYWEESR